MNGGTFVADHGHFGVPVKIGIAVDAVTHALTNQFLLTIVSKTWCIKFALSGDSKNTNLGSISTQRNTALVCSKQFHAKKALTSLVFSAFFQNNCYFGSRY